MITDKFILLSKILVMIARSSLSVPVISRAPILYGLESIRLVVIHDIVSYDCLFDDQGYIQTSERLQLLLSRRCSKESPLRL